MFEPTFLSPQAAGGVSLSRCPSTPAASGTAPLRDTTADDRSHNSPRSAPRRHPPQVRLHRRHRGGSFWVELAQTGGSAGIRGAPEVGWGRLQDPEGSQREHKSYICCHSNCWLLLDVFLSWRCAGWGVTGTNSVGHTCWYSWQEDEEGPPRLLQLSHSSASQSTTVSRKSAAQSLSGGHRETSGMSLGNRREGWG